MLPMNQPFIDIISDKATKWVGSTASLVVHTILFTASFLSHWIFGFDFDSVLLIVTTIVSLEAIYISIFIQRAVNQQGQRLIDVEEDIAEVDRALDDVEEALDDVEEALDEVEETLTEQEEEIADLPSDMSKNFQEVLDQMKSLADELQAMSDSRKGRK